jgi:hypothetical protein
MRTFVIADAHGHPEVIQAALDHGGFAPGRDRMVFGGDFLDRGPDPEGCLDLIERYATEVLVGNHDLAVLLDTFIWPQEPESPRYRPLLIDKVLHKDPNYAWKAVATAEGTLVSHAGISARYQRVFRETCGGEPALLAEHLNDEFREVVRRRLETGKIDLEGLVGDDGPFWFRPPPYSRVPPLAGVQQVAGHSPPMRELAGRGFYMIDPCVWMTELGEPLRFRYAVIEEGRVRVEEGHVELRPELPAAPELAAGVELLAAPELAAGVELPAGREAAAGGDLAAGPGFAPDGEGANGEGPGG